MSLTFGVEIECLMPSGTNVSYQTVAERITEAGVYCSFAGYTHGRNSQWKIVTDASVSGPGYYGMEVVSPILSADDFDQIDKVCAVLSSLRAQVNRTCGLHIHVGTSGVSLDALKRLAVLYGEVEPLIDNLMPPSRRASMNAYAQTLTALVRRQNEVKAARAASELANLVSAGRYGKVNFASRHPTIEFRQHSGTIDPAKIRHWARFCAKLVETAQREEVLMRDVPVVVPAVPVDVAGGWWTWRHRRADADPNFINRGDYAFWGENIQLETIHDLLSRPEGVTRPEAREALGLNSDPMVTAYARRANASIAEVGTRGGWRVWRFVSRRAASTARPSAANPYWNTTNTTRAIYHLLSRSEGGTAEEVRVVAGDRGSRPNLTWHARRAGVEIALTGQRRGGRQVWRFAAQAATPTPAPVEVVFHPPAPVALPRAPSTLMELLDRLQVEEADRVFWQERVALLGTG